MTREFVLENPRPYDIVVVYSVTAHCDLCEDVRSEMEFAVYSFVNQPEKQTRPCFFGVLYHSKEMSPVFQYHGFTTVPYITAYL